MITMDFLDNIVDKMTGWEKNISHDDCQNIINQWRLNGDEVPGGFTASMLHRLYSGESARTIFEQMCRAGAYRDVLSRLQWIESDYAKATEKMEKHKSGEAVLDDEKLQELKIEIGKLSCLKDTTWWIIQRIGIPLQQIQIGERNYTWVIDVDRC